MSHESHDVDELGWSGLGHMTEPDHHKYKDPNWNIVFNPFFSLSMFEVNITSVEEYNTLQFDLPIRVALIVLTSVIILLGLGG